MNWNRIEGNWKQLKGGAKLRWGKFTDDRLDMIAGKHDILAGKIQESRGVSQEDLETQLVLWNRRQKDTV